MGWDPCRATAVQIRARIASGRTSAAEVAEAHLDRIAVLEPGLAAMAHLDPDAVRIWALAAPDGPLYGLPLGVKDVIDVAGLPTGCNSPIWVGHVARADAAAVALARAAGAVVMGKTVTAEFATRHPGPTRNPVNPAHTPGGSSSGSAAGVAAGYFPFALATQTAGSIIRPAAFCGVVGFKPSFGTVHRGGMRVIAESLDTIGVIARTVGDCALLAAALAPGEDFGDPQARRPRPPRLAFTYGGARDAAAPCVQAMLETAAETLAARGAQVTWLDLPETVLAAGHLQRTVMYAEAAQALAWELAAHPALLSEGLRERLEAGRALPPGALPQARRRMAEARAAHAALAQDFDAILTPSATAEAPLGLADTGDPAFNLLWSALHLPCVSIPVGTGPLGLPLGLQAVGLKGRDGALLEWAEWIRQGLD